MLSRARLAAGLLLALSACGRSEFVAPGLPGATETPAGTATPSGSATPGATPAGTLDPNYGTAGRATGLFGAGSIAHRAIPGPGGTTLVAGRIDIDADTRHAGVARFDATGALDASFANGGWADIALAPKSWANAIAMDAGGGLWIAGATDGSEVHAVLAHLLPSGALDGAFTAVDLNGNGKQSEANAIAVRADGSFFVGASWMDNNDKWSFLVALRSANGASVTSFGTNGVVKIPCAAACVLADVAIAPSGGVYVAGTEGGSPKRFVVRALTGSGAAMPGFAPWTWSSSNDTVLNRMTSLPGGGVLLAGSIATNGGNNASDMALAKLDANGAPDGSFGTNGLATFDLGADGEWASRILALPDGTFAVAATSNGLGVLRLNANGTKATGYGTNGWVGAAQSGDGSCDLVLEGGALLVIGTDAGSPESFVLARFL